MKSKKGIILIVLLLTLTGGILYALKEYNRKSVSLNELKEDFTVSAGSLADEFSQEQAAANQKYLGKTLLVKGRVVAIDHSDPQNTMIVLGENGLTTSIRGSLDSALLQQNPAVKEKDSIHLKGTCTGYLPDDMGLGADIILNKCYITENKK